MEWKIIGMLLFVLKVPPDLGFGDATFRGYSGPLRTLNAELVLIVPYGAERSSNKRRS